MSAAPRSSGLLLALAVAIAPVAGCGGSSDTPPELPPDTPIKLGDDSPLDRLGADQAAPPRN